MMRRLSKRVPRRKRPTGCALVKNYSLELESKFGRFFLKPHGATPLKQHIRERSFLNLLRVKFAPCAKKVYLNQGLTDLNDLMSISKMMSLRLPKLLAVRSK